MTATKRKPKRFPTNWLVRLFNATGQQVDSFKIEGKFSWEVSTIVEIVKPKYDDWTMTPLN